MRTRTRTVGANTVHEQAFWEAANPTWYVWSGSAACAANKHFLSFLNNGGSGQVFKVRKLYLINTAVAAVTGVALQFDIKRITACSGGSAITPQIVDSTDTAIANVTVQSAPTAVTEGAVLFPWYTTNDEIGATNAFPSSFIQSATNLLPEGVEVKELVLNAGEGVTVKQITSSTVGSFGVLMVVTKEP
jgi:hypothetical protein